MIEMIDIDRYRSIESGGGQKSGFKEVDQIIKLKKLYLED